MEISLFSRGIKVTPPRPVEPPVDARPPERVALVLRQCVGRPADPVVEVGERVDRGAVVAEGADDAAAHLHAPIGGEVTGFEIGRAHV